LAVSLLSLIFFATVPSATAQSWLTLTPRGEGFSVQFPVRPNEEAGRSPVNGDDYLMKTYTATDESSRLMYMAVLQEFPEAVASLKPAERLDQFIIGFKQGFIKELEATCPEVQLPLERELTLKDRAGRQYGLSCRGIRGLIRVYDNQRRLYVLMVMGGDETNADVAKFLQSFAILPAPVPVPLPKTETKSPGN
jgi:hypothetical protein